jgi:enterochelin esterase-like enzyme
MGHDLRSEDRRLVRKFLLSSLALVGVWAGGGRPYAQFTPGGHQREPTRVDVTFQLDWPGVTSPDAVFVQGDLPELGAMDPTRAVKLVAVDDVAWRVRISLPVDRVYRYRYVRRSSRAGDLRDPTNLEPLTPLVFASTPAMLGGPGEKTLQVRTDIPDPELHWRLVDGPFLDEFATEALELLGPGRTADEQHYGARAFARAQRRVEFYLASHDGSRRDPSDPAQSYSTTLDQIFLQDGELFSYIPSAQVSPMRRAYTAPLEIDSSILGATRTYRVMLPRGYNEHATRRYPVLYQYDGQHLWDIQAGQFGFWDQDGSILASLVRSGEVGEVIHVGVDHLGLITDPCVNVERGRDCLSPEDVVDEGFFCGRVRGEADRFLSFVVEELKPLIDATYRTRPDRAHTFAAGYSYGAVFALYAGWEFNATFGAVAPQSGSFWVPRFPARVMAEPKKDLRIYLDTGDTEPSISAPAKLLYDSFLGRRPGYVLGRDFQYHVGFEQDHGFTNGGLRMRSMMSFLWPATRERADVPWP